jgi:serum/glucocorticoid-regulated kinase 2
MLDWRGHVKIVDFGLSKKLSKKTMMTHSFVGTDGYVSPEIMDRKGHNFTTDLYNLGVMLYDFLHARPPYSKFDPASGTYVPSRNSQLTFSNEISEDAKSLLRLLLDKNPNMRLGGEQQTRCLLYHPWFKSVRAALEAGDELKVPTSKDLSLNIFQSEDFIDEIDDLVDNLESKLLSLSRGL